jgi:hypothetical protein
MVIGILDWLKNLASYVSSLPAGYSKVTALAVYMILIFVYALFIWKVYKAISKKDIISINLGQYNSFEHPVANKVFAALLYFIEYIIILPFLIFFWYLLFAIVLLFFSENLSLENILLLSAAVVGSIRLLAYYKHEIAMDIAKLLPLTILGITILNPKFLELSRFVDSFNQLPELLLSVGYALVFIVSLEIILRFLDLFRRVIFDYGDEEEKDD